MKTIKFFTPILIGIAVFIGCIYLDALVIDSILEPLRVEIGAAFALVKFIVWVVVLALTLSLAFGVSYFIGMFLALILWQDL